MLDTQTSRCLDFFSDIIGILKTTHQHERVFHFITDRIIRLYKCQTCAIVLIDRTTEYLNVENSHGLSWTFCKQFRRKLATGAIGELLWTGKQIMINDSDADPQTADDVRLEHRFGSCACVQVAINHRTAGYLYVDSTEKSFFTEADMKLLQTFADVAAIALYKDQLYEENLRLDRVDHETNLEKYAPFVERLVTHYEKAKDTGEPFGVMILDVDNYKKIVNTYGYGASQQFLLELGDVVRSQMRAIDVAGRYGTDEVIVMLPGTSLEEAIAIAQKLRKAVEDSTFASANIKATVSVGVSAYPQNGKVVDDVMLSARKALFEAQRAGRNNVYHYMKEWYARDAELCVQ